MAIINPIKEAPWFSIDEDQYLMYLLKGYEIQLSDSKRYVYFSLDGRYHREDGPAIIDKDGSVQYFQNGKRHREDGPAFIWRDDYVEYWLIGVLYSTEEYYEKLKDGTY